MTSITRITLDMENQQLFLSLDQGNKKIEALCFPMEYLRVIDHDHHLKNTNKKSPLVTNCKNVRLTAVESVGKHGLRFLFDDGFQKILAVKEIEILNAQQETLWQQYLDDIKNSGLTRETAIEIKAL